MKRFIVGVDRTQSTLLPEQLDDYVTEENAVRVVDLFVDQLDLGTMGFAGVHAAKTGRPSYHPAVLLKLYIYGYLNRIQSSRRLEKEAQRNLELMWLTGRLKPDFKTIADFRKNNGAAIGKVCRKFVLLCRELDFFKDAEVAIDGSKFKAVNSCDKNFTENKLKTRIEKLENSIARYMEELDRADRQPELVSVDRVKLLKERVDAFKVQIEKFNELNKKLQLTEDKQISLTDPDARSMTKRGRGTGMVGYNVQTSVDTKHHLIVAHEVTNRTNDHGQLASMAVQSKQETGIDALTVFADRGYYSGSEIRACDEQGITALVPKPLTSPSRFHGRFDKRDFLYQPKNDVYLCPAGQLLTRHNPSHSRGVLMQNYSTAACSKCAMKARCTLSEYRHIQRSEHEDILDRMAQKLNERGDAPRIRRQTVEHPYGTLKAWMGATHFLTRTLPRVKAEMSLHVLAYNLKRMMAIMGMRELMEAMRA